MTRRLTAAAKAIAGNRLAFAKRWVGDSTNPSEEQSYVMVDDVDAANLVTSQTKEDPHLHTVVLDIDMPAELVPSSTPGHFHLYIDKPMTWNDYVDLLEMLGRVGIIEPGYVGASKARGFTAVRLPWVKKPQQPQPEIPGQLAFHIDDGLVKTSGFEPVIENEISGTQLTESTVRRLLAHGLATDAERTWLMNLDAAREKDPF